jgi:hypothetical protein
VEFVAGLRWLVVFLFWVALDLSGPLLLVPAEAFEESEEGAHRPSLRRRAREPGLRAASPRRPEVDVEAARSSRLAAAAASPHRGPEAATPRKLPPSDADPDSASDDH